jgi:MFS family permease
MLPDEQLYSWGWRIPFFLSAIVVAVGYVIRRTLDETPVFTAEAERDQVASLPVAVLFRERWADVLKVAAASLVSTVSTISGVYALSYATSDHVGLSRTTMLTLSILAAFCALFSITGWALLADKVGRKKIYVFGCLGSGVLMFAYLGALDTGHVPLVFLFGLLMSGVVYHAQNGVFPALYGEQFPAQVRLSGTAIGTQVGFALSGFMPTVAAAIGSDDAGGWIPVAVLTLVCAGIAAVAAMTMRETYRVATDDLGTTPPRTIPEPALR